MAETVNDYLQAVPESRRERVKRLHRLIVTLYPAAIVDMSYRMPTYRHAQGWVALANQKQYVSLYTCSPAHIEAFKRKHPAIKTGKGCINFRDQNELPLDAIEDVIRRAMEMRKPLAKDRAVRRKT